MSLSFQGKMNFLINNEFKKYRERSYLFFDYLSNRSKVGFTPRQFQIYRDNFFFRTLNTIPSIAKVIIAAALNSDLETLSEVGKNMYQETGRGNYYKSHSALLEYSHSIHSEKIFKIPKITLKDSSHSSLLLKESILFRETQNYLYSQENYLAILATSFAQESAAHSMLTALYESFFLPYRSWYDQKEFEAISEYYLCHINGLERLHGKLAKQAILRVCQNEKDLKHIIESISTFLGIQADLWIAMFKEMNNSYKEIDLIAISPNLLY